MTESTSSEPVRATTIGVAGGSGSGKTTVAQSILERIGRERIASLVQDAYYKQIEWSGEGQLRDHNFDHPDALDNDLLVDQLAALRRGEAVEVPVYDFTTHRRTEQTRRVEPRPVVLIEGILLFVEPRVRDLLDLKIFVDTDADVRLMRRIERDTTERGRTVDSVLDQYRRTVRPMHLEFIEPSKRYADVIVPEGGGNQAAMRMMTALVRQLLDGEIQG